RFHRDVAILFAYPAQQAIAADSIDGRLRTRRDDSLAPASTAPATSSTRSAGATSASATSPRGYDRGAWDRNTRRQASGARESRRGDLRLIALVAERRFEEFSADFRICRVDRV